MGKYSLSGSAAAELSGREPPTGVTIEYGEPLGEAIDPSPVLAAAPAGAEAVAADKDAGLKPKSAKSSSSAVIGGGEGGGAVLGARGVRIGEGVSHATRTAVAIKMVDRVITGGSAGNCETSDAQA